MRADKPSTCGAWQPCAVRRRSVRASSGGCRMASVLVCDDSPLARESIRRAVAAIPGIDRVSVAVSGEEVLVRWPTERPDLVLMDVRMPGIGGVEASRRLIAAHAGATVVMLTMAEDRDGSARRPRTEGMGTPPALTERELQVLGGMSRGLSNAEIGRELYLSEDTVKTHARRLFRKVGAADRAQAVALGFRWGFVR